MAFSSFCGTVSLRRDRFNALLFEGGFIQVDIRANKETRPAFNGGAKSVEVPQSLALQREWLLGFGGDRNVVPSIVFLSQVSILVNQLSGGSFVVPRRKATMSSRWLDWLAGRSALTISCRRCRLGTDDGQRGASARDADVDLGLRVETGVIGTESSGDGSGEMQAATNRSFIRY